MVSFFSIFLHVEKYWWFQAFHYGFHSAPSNSSRNCSWSSPYWHFVYSKPQKMPKSNDISLFRIKLFKSFWGLRLFMSGCFGLPRRRLWLIIGSLSLSPFLNWFVYNALKNNERWSCATVSFTKVYPKFWSPILWRGSARCPLQGRTFAKSWSRENLVAPVEFNMEPWNFKWCLEMFGQWYSHMFIC